MKKKSNQTIFNHVWAKHSYAEKYKQGSYCSFQFLHQFKPKMKFYLQFLGELKVLFSMDLRQKHLPSFLTWEWITCFFNTLPVFLSYIRTKFTKQTISSSMLLCKINANPRYFRLARLFSCDKTLLIWVVFSLVAADAIIFILTCNIPPYLLLSYSSWKKSPLISHFPFHLLLVSPCERLCSS